ACNHPSIVADGGAFNTRFSLPQFNVGGGTTLTVLNQTGSASGLPANSTPGDWDLEEALDVQWAHAMAPKANIVLFEAASAGLNDLLAAVTTASGYAGVSAISMSWGAGEFSGETSFDSTFHTPADLSLDANPSSGVYVLDSYYGGSNGWYTVGGTSLSCPLMAGLVAVANQGRVLKGLGTLDGPTQTLPSIYNQSPSFLHDV